MNQDLRDLIERARRAQAQRPPSDAIAWPDTTGLDSEAAILADCEALVDAGQAMWVATNGTCPIADEGTK
ncbi:MAG: hypothetical protein H0U00_06905 [Actinobacteria bacterium]|nr:hypothetical protein [Actinomycetota bacterium]